MGGAGCRGGPGGPGPSRVQVCIVIPLDLLRETSGFAQAHCPLLVASVGTPSAWREAPHTNPCSLYCTNSTPSMAQLYLETPDRNPQFENSAEWLPAWRTWSSKLKFSYANKPQVFSGFAYTRSRNRRCFSAGGGTSQHSVI